MRDNVAACRRALLASLGTRVCALQRLSRRVPKPTSPRNRFHRVVAWPSLAGAASAAVLLAPSPAVADSCPNAALRVGPSASLPDCRAYEQVTPPDKEASNDLFAPDNTEHSLAAPNGGKVLLQTGSAFGPDPDGVGQTYVFSRGATGWKMTPITPANAGVTHYDPTVFSPDLSNIGIATWTAAADKSNVAQDLLLGAPGGPYTSVASAPPGGVTDTFIPDGGVQMFTGGSSDLSRVLFLSNDHSLVPSAAGQVAPSWALYQWASGHLSLVNVTTAGTLTSACGAALGSGIEPGVAHNAVSNDGSKIFFLSPDPTAVNKGASDPSCSQPTHLYMRLNGNQTVDVSAPSPGVNDPTGFHSVAYEGAAADGSKVFFITTTELTADDTDHDLDIYEYDTDSGVLTRVSRGTSGTGNADAQWGIVSDDGSTVYFLAKGQLAPGAPVVDTDHLNVYRYDTTSGQTSYITTIGPGLVDVTSTSGQGHVQVGDSPLDQGPKAAPNWYTTPNGRYLIFSSSVNITGYNPNPGGSQFRELYRYDSVGNAVICLSCPPNNAPATGDGSFSAVGGALKDLLTPDQRTARPISDDGQYAFFESPERLVSGDTNNNEDVYEWHDGAISLISSGKDSTASFFLDSSADGKDVFFGTHGLLAPTDTDFEGDLYDARVDGGFPSSASPSECSDDSCQGGLSAVPSLPSAASIAFSGAGNLTSTPRVRVLHKALRGSRFALAVKVPARGRIRISGHWLIPVRRAAAKAGTYHLIVHLSPRGRRALRHRRKLKVRVHVKFAPQTGQSSSTAVSLTVKR